MNREIKFRGYSEELKSWVYGFYHEVEAEGIRYSYIFWQGNVTQVRPDSVAQFTGLIDKKGKEVYESDIIKWKETRFHTEKQKENGVPMPKFYKSAIEWQDGEFIVSSDDNKDTPLCCFFGDSLDNKFDFKAEIIGNIYENPELLSGSA